MPHSPGDIVLPGDDSVTIDGDGSADAGDAVGIDGDGKATQGDANEGDEFAGVSPFDFGEDGDKENMTRHAGQVVNVADGVSAGERLDLADSSTEGEEAGQLSPSEGGPALALSDEGGQHPTTGTAIPDGFAVVDY